MKKTLLGFVLGLVFLSVSEAQNLGMEAWRACWQKFDEHAHPHQMGRVAYEAALVGSCGPMPTMDYSPRSLQGRLLSDVIASEPWRGRFEQSVGSWYVFFKDALAHSTTMQQEGDWFVGQGHGAHGAKAIVAINVKTQHILAAYMDDEETQWFGLQQKGLKKPKSFATWQRQNGRLR